MLFAVDQQQYVQGSSDRHAHALQVQPQHDAVAASRADRARLVTQDNAADVADLAANGTR